MNLPLKGVIAHIVLQLLLAGVWSTTLALGIVFERAHHCYGDALLLIGIAGLTTSALSTIHGCLGLCMELKHVRMFDFLLTFLAAIIITMSQITSFVLLMIDRETYGCYAAGLTMSSVVIVFTAGATYVLWLFMGYCFGGDYSTRGKT